jgi:hypothetical protein
LGRAAVVQPIKLWYSGKHGYATNSIAMFVIQFLQKLRGRDGYNREKDGQFPNDELPRHRFARERDIMLMHYNAAVLMDSPS